jgi:hypothetical protein
MPTKRDPVIVVSTVVTLTLVLCLAALAVAFTIYTIRALFL